LTRDRPGITVGIVLLALGACTPTGGSHGVPAGGETVRFDVAADPASLNPLFAHPDAGNVEGQLARLAFEPFYDLDGSGRAVPALLRELPTVRNGGLSRDGRTIVYRLRPGVRWSDGVPVTSRDVLFTLAAIRNDANPVASREGYELIDRAQARGPLEVRLHFRAAWAPAVATFFAPGPNAQYVLPAHVLERQAPLAKAPFGAEPLVGDGPFRFESWQRGDRIHYVANPTYWRGRPGVAALDVRIVPDPQTNLTLLRSGAIDFVLVAPSQVPALGGTPGLTFPSVATALVAGIAMNVEHPPLDDPRVRRALAAAIDRGGISKKITLGRYPVAQSDRPRFSWAYDAAVAQPAFDPGAADRDLDAAGWRRGPDGRRRKAGHPLALEYVQFPETTTGVRTAAVVQRELDERGVSVTIVPVSNAQLFLPAADGGVLARGKFDLAYVPWAMGADPDDRFLYGCGSARQNYMRWCDRAVQRLEAIGATEPERGKRRAAYVAIDRIVARDVPVMWLFSATYVYAVGPRLAGFAPNAFMPTWNAYAWKLRPRASGR